MAQGRGCGAGGGLGRPGGAGAKRVRRAFVLAEAGAVVVVLVVASALLMVGAGQSRKSAGLAGSLANLRKIGETTGAYAADFDDRLWYYTWNPDEHPTEYDDLQDPLSPYRATLWQSVDIIRRLTGKDDHPRFDAGFPPFYYSTLVLADYLNDPLPSDWSVSPGDRVRLGWAATPDSPPDIWEFEPSEFEASFGPYGSSYVLMPAFIAPDEKVGTQQAIYQSAPYHLSMWLPPKIDFGERRLSEVSFPGAKVHMAERESYFFGPRPVYYLHPSARVPVLMADGAASPRSTADANASWKPNLPLSQGSTLLDYVPQSGFEAPAVDEVMGFDDNLEGAYKWTRGGLSGIDFAGEREE